jgi:hypothetical protein
VTILCQTRFIFSLNFFLCEVRTSTHTTSAKKCDGYQIIADQHCRDWGELCRSIEIDTDEHSSVGDYSR